MSKGQKVKKALAPTQPIVEPVYPPLGGSQDAVQVCWANEAGVKRMLGEPLASTEGVIQESPYYSDTCGETAPYMLLVFTSGGKDYFVKQGDYFLRGTIDEYWVWTPDEYADGS